MQTPTARPGPADAPPSDHDRFLDLVEAHRRALLKVCWAYANTPHDRDDLLQEIVARLWGAFARYDPARKFSTWMYRVALNVAIDFRRRQRRWGRESAGLEGAEAVPEDATRQQLLREVRELLDRLGEADRAMLVLYLEGHSYREIGDVLGLSESNVGTRLNRLKSSLRQSAQTPTEERE